MQNKMAMRSRWTVSADFFKDLNKSREMETVESDLQKYLQEKMLSYHKSLTISKIQNFRGFWESLKQYQVVYISFYTKFINKKPWQRII